MKPIISISDEQIHIDDEHYTLFIRFKHPEVKVKEVSPVHGLKKIKTCINCGKEFKSNYNRSTLCSDKCREDHKKHYLKSWRKKNESNIDTTLREIEEKRKQPYKVTPPVA
jgi:predicted nucleic acid-binding Zn ribbon protein